MKILRAGQIRAADEHTIKSEPISSLDLMERAGGQCAEWIYEKYPMDTRILAVCGVGNNGGDGLVIVRKLLEKGYIAGALILKISENHSEDFKTNLDRLDPSTYELLDAGSGDLPLNEADVLIDCIFGTGLTRPVVDWAADCIDQLNSSLIDIISVDIPSGLFCEDNTHNTGAIIQSTTTLTFECPKLAMLLPENYEYVGDFHVLDIGLDKSFIQSMETPFSLIEEKDLIVVERNKFDHKGTFGHALIISGSFGKMGAAVLSAKACLRAGAGLVTSHTPAIGYFIMQSTVPEAMLSVDKAKDRVTQVEIGDRVNAVGIGPGLGTFQETVSVIDTVLSANCPVVIDADALNLLSENKEMLRKLHNQCILTPHLKEFERLAGKCSSAFERLELQRAFSREHEVVVVLKGAHTSISSPDGQVVFNSTGNPYMATAGSGDILTGIIVAMLAQGLDPLNAAITGVFLHGKAGDFAHELRGNIIASDILDCL